MADIVTPEVRSRMMSGIRGKNTKPELLVRKGLHRRGFRYRIHARYIAGRPDLFLRKFNAALFVHGCFWHGHDCPLFRMPATRREFWEQKMSRNRERDCAVSRKLDDAGIRHLTVWECALRGPTRLGEQEVLDKISVWLSGTDMVGTVQGS